MGQSSSGRKVDWSKSSHIKLAGGCNSIGGEVLRGGGVLERISSGGLLDSWVLQDGVRELIVARESIAWDLGGGMSERFCSGGGLEFMRSPGDEWNDAPPETSE